MKEPTLLEKQACFSILFSKLICDIVRRGYSVTLGECWRPPEMASIYAKQGKGIKNSLHTLRLAADINIFFKNKLLTKKEDYEGIALYWKSLGTLEFKTAWGGDFKSGDFGHFSIAHNGVK